MADWLRSRVLRLMRVPPEPAPPLGAPGSVRRFRAGENYFKVLLARWAVGQFGAAVGLAFSVLFFWWFHSAVLTAHQLRDQAAAALAVTPAPALSAPPATAKEPGTPAKKRRPRLDKKDALDRVVDFTPLWALTILEILEIGGIVIFIVQIPLTLAAVRLEFELHWYIVTDRSLRIRTGIFTVRESTMSFANLQQVEIKQGPIQRLLGLADVHVRSAGGGSEGHEHAADDALHTGVFHCVEHAQEIRDLILERLRKFRETGLGDPDDHGAQAMPAAPASSPGDALTAARDLLAETRALRQALTS